MNIQNLFESTFGSEEMKEENMEKRKTQERHQKEYNTLVEFLKQTREGKYAIIERASLPYARIKEETEVIVDYEEEYYYSVS